MWSAIDSRSARYPAHAQTENQRERLRLFRRVRGDLDHLESVAVTRFVDGMRKISTLTVLPTGSQTKFGTHCRRQLCRAYHNATFTRTQIFDWFAFLLRKVAFFFTCPTFIMNSGIHYLRLRTTAVSLDFKKSTWRRLMRRSVTWQVSYTGKTPVLGQKRINAISYAGQIAGSRGRLSFSVISSRSTWSALLSHGLTSTLRHAWTQIRLEYPYLARRFIR